MKITNIDDFKTEYKPLTEAEKDEIRADLFTPLMSHIMRSCEGKGVKPNEVVAATRSALGCGNLKDYQALLKTRKASEK